jgi:hypothetical protein
MEQLECKLLSTLLGGARPAGDVRKPIGNGNSILGALFRLNADKTAQDPLGKKSLAGTFKGSCRWALGTRLVSRRTTRN